MTDHELDTIRSTNWKPRAMVVGTILGALVGATAAYLFIQNAEEDKPLKFSAGEGVKLGVMVLGLLRSISSLKE